MLKSVGTSFIDTLWPEDRSRLANLTPGEARQSGDALYEKLVSLNPQNKGQEMLKARALDVAVEMAQIRMRLFTQQDNALPRPFFVVLVFWLTILFAGYGLLAPGNATVILVLIVSALSVSGAVYLMLELGSPFTGLVRVPREPLQNAVSLIGPN
jgi:hypothetical protein